MGDLEQSASGATNPQANGASLLETFEGGIVALGEFLEGQSLKQGDRVEGYVKTAEVIKDSEERSWAMVESSEGALLGRVALEEVTGLPQSEKLSFLVESLAKEPQRTVLSRKKACLYELCESLNAAVESKKPVSATVLSRQRGGFSVDIGIKAFLPYRELGVRGDFDSMIGQKFDVLVQKFDLKRGVVVSRAALVATESTEIAAKLADAYANGTPVEGVVKNIIKFGAFVDLGGGVDALLHIADMRYSHVKRPSDVVSVGDRIKVKVLQFGEGQKTRVGLKQLTTDPFIEVETRFPVGSVVEGEIESVAEFGLFVALADDIQGLIHSSEIAWGVRHPLKGYAVGQKVKAMVLSHDVERRRIRLSIKKTQENPWTTLKQRYPVGTCIKGTIHTVVDYGLFVTVSQNVDGLVHINDLPWVGAHGKPQDYYQKGQELEVMILEIDDERERITLGVKQIAGVDLIEVPEIKKETAENSASEVTTETPSAETENP